MNVLKVFACLSFLALGGGILALIHEFGKYADDIYNDDL